ncbi:MAG: hypothetical protein K6348_00405 [Deferribacterales bacterium]
MYYYKKIFNLIPDFIFVHDDVGLIKNMNQAALLHYKNFKYLSEVIKDAKIINKIYNYKEDKCLNCGEISITLPNGSTIDVEISSYPFEIAFGKSYKLTILKNISQMKEIEKQFCIAQKQEAIGAMAAGFAHDFKNILNNIKLYVKLIKQSSDIDQIKNYTNVIENIITDSNEFVKQVLNVARDKSSKFEKIVLSDLLSELVHILERVIPRNVSIGFTDMAKNAIVNIIKTRFINMVLNLCQNAVEAIGSNSGHIHIATERIEQNNIKYIKLSVTDNGPGIPKDILNKIFDNFFTTKSGGTGLGLAMVKLAAKDFGGYVEVESELGVSTTFKIFIPEAKYGDN